MGWEWEGRVEVQELLEEVGHEVVVGGGIDERSLPTFPVESVKVRQFVDGALSKKVEMSLEVGHGGSEGVGIDSCSSNTFKTELSGKLGRSYRGS